MKKITILSLLAVLLVNSFDLSADEDDRRRRRHRRRGGAGMELALNATSLLYLAPNFYFGINPNENISVGLNLGYIATPYASTVTSNGTVEDRSGRFSGISIGPEFRYFFSPDNGNDRWFAGAYLKYKTAGTPDDAFVEVDMSDPWNPDPASIEYGMSYNNITPGLQGGYLWQFDSGFQLTFFGGTGYALYHNVKYTEDLGESFTQDVLGFATRFDFHGGVNIGWRF